MLATQRSDHMRIGIIADIHGNNLALDTVLAQLDLRGADTIVCLGDVAMLGPQPAESIATLQALQIPVVMGNTDAWFFGGDQPGPETALLAGWCREQVSRDDIDYVQSFAPSIEIALVDGLQLLACHATPRNFDEVISAGTPTSEVQTMLNGASQDLVAGGHTHVQLLRQINQQRFVNPGSVGLPGIGPRSSDLARNLHVDWAEFAIIDTSNNDLAIEFHRTPIDLAELFEIARTVNMPAFDWWTTLWKS
jgi:putative phosphoesterase